MPRHAALVPVLAAFAVAPAHARPSSADEVTCPFPTKAKGSLCTLSGDTTLAATLHVHAGVHLDCGGYRLLPSPTSPPLVAVIVHDTSGAKVTGCRIEGFEQGIYVVRTPASLVSDTDPTTRHQNWINDNVIDVRVKGITLWGAEDTRIERNVVTIRSNYGAVIGVWRGSHRNVIRGNTLVNQGGPAGEPAPRDFPGVGDPISYSPPAPPAAVGIAVGNGGAEIGIVQFVLDDELFQFPVTPGFEGVMDNVIEDNTITVAGSDAIFLSARNQGTVVRGNDIEVDPVRVARGIRVRGGSSGTVQIPSQCMHETSRWCFRDADCNPPLASPEPADACQPTPCMWVGTACYYGYPLYGDLTTHDVSVEQNTLSGGLVVGIEVTALDTTIVGNSVEGAAAGLALGAQALGGAWVEGNVLDHNRIGLDLTALPAAHAVVVTRNDITHSTVRALRAPAGSKVALELSYDGEGNHWGRACPDAFLPLPPGPRVCTGDASRSCVDDGACAGAGVCATYDADAPNDSIRDSFPFGEPVADPVLDVPPVPCALAPM